MSERKPPINPVAARDEWFARRWLVEIMKYKVPLPQIKSRGAQTQYVMDILASGTPPWSAPDLPSPGAVLGMVQGVTAQENVLSLKETVLAITAGEWDAILDPWHEEAVTLLKLGRVKYGRTAKGASWSRCKANGRSRERITLEGTDLENTWKESDPAWVPKAGLTFTAFQQRRITAAAKGLLHGQADKAADNERELLVMQANGLYDFCVEWYEVATATFAEDTVAGALIRTIPVNYNPYAAPGRLHFTQHYSPAPNQLKLVWEAARGEHYDIYGKAPGAQEFIKMLNHVPVAEWMSQGMEAGIWAFKGEATNADGTGETSEVIVVPVMAAVAA